MLRVTRRVHGLEVPSAKRDPIALCDRSDPLGRNGFDGPEQRRHRLRPVDGGHAREQAGGVGEVPCAAFVHPDRRVREAFGDAPHTSGVVEMDVRHHDVREVGAPDSETFETCHDGFERRRRSGLDDRRLVRVEQVRGGGASAAAEERVDRGDPSRDLEDDGLHVASLRGCRWAVLRSASKGGVGMIEDTWIEDTWIEDTWIEVLRIQDTW